ncbi:hypothetical protein IT882_00310 [Microbacterium schleiferi]|uniref:Uncharacterized protein n=1 Tax=Microbacterium schleiferi TaxID=69362 RepID=A0A7S8MWU8_9MICO|nr:hypothetical protein [Microbacterium schleiferi]QPE04659.1 hypothetical protein IT882_00310 [Microbacterium schleiferi]
MNRIGNVVRMQFVNRQTYVWLPLIILGSAFLVTLLIWSMLPLEAMKYGGGAQAPMWYFFVLGILSLTQTFPFSQAMSVTRREFFLGTLLSSAVTGFILSAIVLVGGLIEQATNGWGMNGYFFALGWLVSGGPLVGAAVVFALTMVFFVSGFVIGTIYRRFGPLVLTVILVGLALLLLGALWVIGQLDAWAPVFGWIATQGPGGLAIGLVIAFIALSGIGYGLLRRVTS